MPASRSAKPGTARIDGSEDQFVIGSNGLFHRVALLCALLCGICTGIFGILLLANTLRVHGSTAGNILVGGSGILFLLISAALVASSAGALHGSKQMQRN